MEPTAAPQAPSAAERIAEAATIIGRHPQALQLRYLQTLVEVATENNSTTIFPVPIDFLEAFRQGQLAMTRKEGGGSGTSGT